MNNINIVEIINKNENFILSNVKDLLTLRVLHEDIKKIVDKNKQIVLNHFKFENDFKKRHIKDYEVVNNESDIILKVSEDSNLSNKDFKLYLDCVNLLNIKDNLFTQNEEFGAGLVLNSKIIKIEWDLLNLFFNKNDYVSLDKRKEFIELLINMIVSKHNLDIKDFNTNKFKVFGLCDWAEEFIKRISEEATLNPQLLGFINKYFEEVEFL